MYRYRQADDLNRQFLFYKEPCWI